MLHRAPKVVAVVPPVAALSAASVTAVESGIVEVLLGDGGPSRAATIAVQAYTPSPGDRVVVGGTGDVLFVLGVLSSGAATLPLEGGASVTVQRGEAEIRDAEGRLMVRYADGAVEVAAPAGDLVLAAPTGRVVVRAGADVEVHAQRDIRHEATRSVEILAGAAKAPQVRVDATATKVKSAKLEVESKVADVVVGRAAVVARRITTTAETIAQHAETLEVQAHRVVEKARDVFRTASDLLETRAGRARTVIRGLYALSSERTTMASKDDTSIDGKRVLLG
jgi:hypothetical protein